MMNPVHNLCLIQQCDGFKSYVSTKKEKSVPYIMTLNARVEMKKYHYQQ